jgi:choloylglycine hydrolase
MKILFIILAFFGFAYTNLVMGCTTFFLEKNGQMVFGRNYDWVTGTGTINSNLRGLVKNTLELEKGKTLEWESKYGSITFNQYGKEFPNGGMNDEGLVVELMWLSESIYPAPDNRPAFSVLQWIQYQLDNCRTVDEVIATDQTIRITSTGTPQHYLVADRKGSVATIEFLNAKMVVHKGKELPFPVLANSPYQASLEFMNSMSSQKEAPGFQANSGDRFTTACNMIQQYHKPNFNKPVVDYAFDILKNVSQGSFTKWSIVYDIANKKIFYKTPSNTQIKTFDFKKFDFSCASRPLAVDINTKTTGNIDASFKSYSSEVNRMMLKKAFNESKSEINISEDLQEEVALTAEIVKCKS